jgi:methylmalonyl-CoA mutase cobalamin-binding subunit
MSPAERATIRAWVKGHERKARVSRFPADRDRHAAKAEVLREVLREMGARRQAP